jgi:aminopeptidase N
VGTDTFWKGLRTYYQRFQGRTATTADFRSVMEEVSRQDLAWFFGQWLTRSGVPAIEGTWTWDAAAKQVVVDLTQTQVGEPYRLKLDLGLGARVEALDFTGKTLHQTFPVATEPASLSLDPGAWVLMEGRLVKR